MVCWVGGPMKWSVHPSIHFLLLIRDRVSEAALAALSSSSWGIPRCSQSWFGYVVPPASYGSTVPLGLCLGKPPWEGAQVTSLQDDQTTSTDPILHKGAAAVLYSEIPLDVRTPHPITSDNPPWRHPVVCELPFFKASSFHILDQRHMR